MSNFFRKKLVLWDPTTGEALKCEYQNLLIDLSLNYYYLALESLCEYIEENKPPEEGEEIMLQVEKSSVELLDSLDLRCPKSNHVILVNINLYGIYYAGTDTITEQPWITNLIPHNEFAEAFGHELQD